jgi:hypothetical protein
MPENIFAQLLATAKEAGLNIYSTDYLCRFLVILYVYGDAEEEFVINSRLTAIANLAHEMIEKACDEGNAEIIKKIQTYYAQVIKNEAVWLDADLERLGIKKRPMPVWIERDLQKLNAQNNEGQV